MRLELTLRDDWDPYHIKNKWAAVNSHSSPRSLYTDADPISTELMPCRVIERAASHQLLHTNHHSNMAICQDYNFSTIKGVSSRERDLLTPEQLSIMWQIGLKTAKNTILATTHKCICSTGMLTSRFKTDKS